MCSSPTARSGISTSRICNVADSARLFLLSIDLLNHPGRRQNRARYDAFDRRMGQCGRSLFALEFRAALINRYLQLFCALAVAGGIAAAVFSEDANATGFFYLQIALVGFRLNRWEE